MVLAAPTLAVAFRRAGLFAGLFFVTVEGVLAGRAVLGSAEVVGMMVLGAVIAATFWS